MLIILIMRIRSMTVFQVQILAEVVSRSACMDVTLIKRNNARRLAAIRFLHQRRTSHMDYGNAI